VEPRCFIMAVLRNGIWLPCSSVLLPPALIDFSAGKSHCMFTVVARCVAGSWS